MTLTTKSKHQGYVEFPENGSWSWFEVGILSKDKGYGSEAERIRTKQSEDGETLLTFKSHENKVHDRGYVQYTNHFGAHHPIWEELREGDSLGIFGCGEVRDQFEGREYVILVSLIIFMDQEKESD